MLLRLLKIEFEIYSALQEFVPNGPCVCPGGCDDSDVIGWWNEILNLTKLSFGCAYCLAFILVQNKSVSRRNIRDKQHELNQATNPVNKIIQSVKVESGLYRC